MGTTLWARDGEEAVRIAEAENPDLIFMDIQMPNMDGYEATRRLRRMPQFAGLPIIILTAHALTQERQKARKCGCTDLLTKPIKIEVIKSALRRYLPRAAPGKKEDSMSPRETEKRNEVPSEIMAISEETREPGNRETRALDLKVSNELFLRDSAYREVLDSFVQEFPDRLKELDDMLDREDWEGLHRWGHALRGVAGNFTLDRLYEFARGVDEKAQKPGGHQGRLRGGKGPLRGVGAEGKSRGDEGCGMKDSE